MSINVTESMVFDFSLKKYKKTIKPIIPIIKSKPNSIKDLFSNEIGSLKVIEKIKWYIPITGCIKVLIRRRTGETYLNFDALNVDMLYNSPTAKDNVIGFKLFTANNWIEFQPNERPNGLLSINVAKNPIAPKKRIISAIL